jgi:prepilin-type N-terminal cleavage/methylation domain-containing protein
MTTSPQRGFTLVETLVAIAVVMIAVVGPYYSVQQAIMASNAARDQLIASSLAQEAVENIYFLRNSNYLAGRSWLWNMSDCMTTDGCYVLPVSGGTPVSCGAGGCPALRMCTVFGYTIYSSTNCSGTTSRFTRTVKIETIAADKQVLVTVRVNWVTNGRSYVVVVNENLYNWL